MSDFRFRDFVDAEVSSVEAVGFAVLVRPAKLPSHEQLLSLCSFRVFICRIFSVQH
nr:hypothetical protein Iba_chr11bCG9980 [Ipomoea batatas]